ncbi:phasin family protein [Pseudoduganella lutea]|uniref:Phasin family protein n=1 Tax=Pseudoduganella lutea TaxID=321985 RepID=A0A4P6KRY0_9BURK|nr:phasin family protein [Pseudoduganella lutea]QBE61849.1 phasin family protein [Pseudoduganella lutea]
MFSIPEQFSNATKTTFQSQLAIFSTLTGKAFEGIEKLVDLNLTTAKASLDNSSSTAKQLLSAKNPQEFFALGTAQAQPAAEKAVAYGRQASSIVAATAAEFTKVAKEQALETNNKVISLVNQVSRNAPAGSEKAVAFFKSAMGGADAGYRQLTKATKQASDVIEGNVNAAVEQFTSAVKKSPLGAAS